MKADRPLRVTVIVEEEMTAKTVAVPDFPKNADESDWTRFSSQLLSGAYGDDEPDYSDVVVREQNPEFVAWRRDK